MTSKFLNNSSSKSVDIADVSGLVDILSNVTRDIAIATENAQTDASAAQASADQAITDAAAAQGTANTANSAASAAQSTANTAVSDAANALGQANLATLWVTNALYETAANLASIGINASAIAANTSSIGINASAIASNTSNVGINSADISTNTSAISVNTGAITSNLSAIGVNLGSIASNLAAIGVNSSAIGTVQQLANNAVTTANATAAALSALPTSVGVLRLSEYHLTSGNGANPGNSIAYIDTNKRVRCSGASNAYKYGPRTPYAPAYTLPLPGNEKAAKIFNVYQTIYVISESGKVYAAGVNSDGQLGVGNTTVYASGLQQVVALPITTTEILSNNTDGSNVTVFARTSDGKLYAWGWNQYGALGDGTTNNRYTPFLTLGVGNTNTGGGAPTGSVSKVVFQGGVENGSYYTNTVAAIVIPSGPVVPVGGEVWCSGYGTNGALGNNTFTNIPTTWQRVLAPNLQPLDNVTKLGGTGTRSYGTFFALCDESSVGVMYCWGANIYREGGLGNVYNINRATQLLPPTTGAIDVKNFWCVTGSAGNSIYVQDKTTNEIYSCGTNTYGELGIGNTTDKNVLTKCGSGINDYKDYITDIKGNGASDAHSVFAIVTGHSSVQLLVCGHNAQFQLGTGDNVNRQNFTPVNFFSDTGILDVYSTYSSGLGGFTLILDGNKQLYGIGLSQNFRFSVTTDVTVPFPTNVTRHLC